jgi:SulP family sulfate permease
LQERGDWVYILELQGFIFFGTAHRLLEQVRHRLHEANRLTPRFILFDFRQVSGLDASAELSFVKIKQLAQSRNIVLIFTDLSPEMRHQLERQVLTAQDQSAWRTFTDLDHGLEWGEEQLLRLFEGVGFSDKPRPVRRRLGKFLAQSKKLMGLFDSFGLAEPPTSDPPLDGLMAYMEQKKVATGTSLIRQGEEVTGIYFIKEGQVTAQMAGDDGCIVRLRTMRAGTVVGEMGAYLGTPASASVVTDQPSLVFYLSTERLQDLEASAPHLTVAFHKFMVQLQSERLARANDTLRALLG